MSLEAKKFKKLREIFPQISDLEILEKILQNTGEREYRKKVIEHVERNKKAVNYWRDREKPTHDIVRPDFINKTDEEIDFIESIEEISALLCRKKKIIRSNIASQRVLDDNIKHSSFKFNEYTSNKRETWSNIKISTGKTNEEKPSVINLAKKAQIYRKEANEIKEKNTEIFNKPLSNTKIKKSYLIESRMVHIDQNNFMIKELEKESEKILIKKNEVLNKKSNGETLVIDLHCFNLREAVNHIKDVLFSIKLRIRENINCIEPKKNGEFKYNKIEFITGRPDRSFKIRPALLEILKSEAFVYREVGPAVIVNII
ncbi:hypothetical protein CDIK_0658 [Cucumispora dikerogammari]|nr:hypothetical protein CDIK_0658 [Cucumispora dikerogammari]